MWPPGEVFAYGGALTGLAVTGFAVMGVHPAWVAITGEPAWCVLVSLDERPGRHHLITYGLDCPGGRVVFSRREGEPQAGVGDRAELLLDRTGTVDPRFAADSDVPVVGVVLSPVIGASHLVLLVGVPLPPPRPANKDCRTLSLPFLP
ncbi:hypothetical protein [Saccharothrix lopnurensis]|uniref:Uncharacterized protein n=1 Tax=Saccharothrix lopnurensis TaxID=1670621 RepID=A0ABW1P1D8_9PSEU